MNQGYPPYGHDSNQGGYATGAEPVFLQDGGAYVSRSRVVLNGVTYPVNAISAVTARRVPKSGTALILGILGACMSVPFFAFDSGAAIFVGILGLLLSGGLVAIHVWLQRDRYVLVIGTSGMQHQALFAEDAQYVNVVLQAINSALASRA